MQILDKNYEITNIPGQSVKEVIINLRTKKNLLKHAKIQVTHTNGSVIGGHLRIHQDYFVYKLKTL